MALTYATSAVQTKKCSVSYSQRGGMNTQKKFICFLALGLMLLQGCGNKSTSSEEARQYDRDREKSDIISDGYAAINGTFTGVVNNADVVLVVKTTEVTKDGSLVPTPTLVGTLIFMPRVSVGDSQDRVKNFFPYSDGTYDQGSGNFSFTVEKEARPTQVACKATPNTFNCSWYRRLNDVEFVLTRDSEDAINRLNSQNKKLFGGDYVGEATDGFYVRGSFNSGLTDKPDSGIPELSVIGSFVFHSDSEATLNGKTPDHVYSFTDGSYDVSTGIITATAIADNGTPVIANCHVESVNSLFCRWFSREYTEFRIYRESIKPLKPPKK